MSIQLPPHSPGSLPQFRRPPARSAGTGTVNVSTVAALTSAVAASKNACVTADIGDVNFGSGNRAGVVVSTTGSMQAILLNSTTNLTFRAARFRSIELRSAGGTTIDQSVIGGTAQNRVYDQLIFMPDTSNDVVIRNNDIGWTLADNSGNTGYGCRCYGTLNHCSSSATRSTTSPPMASRGSTAPTS